MKNDGFKILTGFFIGAIGGLLTGILIAPDTGKGVKPCVRCLLIFRGVLSF